MLLRCSHFFKGWFTFMKIIISIILLGFMLLKRGFTHLRRMFTFLKRCSHFFKGWFTLMKIISSYYWGLTLLKRGFTFWKSGGSRL